MRASRTGVANEPGLAIPFEAVLRATTPMPPNILTHRNAVPVSLTGRKDFPEWIPPMVVKELRQGLRSQGFALILCLLHLIMLVVFLTSIQFESAEKPLEVSSKVFWCFFSALLFGVTPMRGLQELHSEKQSRTLELLMAAGVSGTRLVLGKWFSLLAQSGLMTLTLLPYFMLQYFGGAVDMLYQMRLMGLSILLCAVATAASLSISGFKMWMRLKWMAFIVFCNLWLLIVILIGVFEQAVMVNFVNNLGWGWVLLVFGAALGSLVFLRLAGDVIDAPSANGALVPRLAVCVGWMVMIGAILCGAGLVVQMLYLALLCVLSAVAFYWQLQAQRPILPVHLQPFRKLGPFFGRIAAFALLPTWVGSVLLAPLPFLGVLLSLFSASKMNTEKVLIGVCLHLVAVVLCLIVLWRIFFARKREASGVVRERDPRFIFQWIAGFSLLFSFVPKMLGVDALLRPVGIYLPIFFFWAYSTKTPGGVSDADFDAYFFHTCISFGIYFLLALILGAVWLSRKPVWKNFWGKPPLAGTPGGSSEMGEEGAIAGGSSRTRPWLETKS
jgi:hypothetical protein